MWNFWVMIGLVALAVSVIMVLALRKRGWWFVVTIASVLILVEGLVVADRARKLDSVYRYEEPFLTTILVAGVPVIAIAVAVGWTGSRGWRATSQIAIGMVAGLSTYMIAGLLGYVFL